MADKQEERPGENPSEYRRVVEIGSASSWDVFELSVFGADFTAGVHDSLPKVVLSYLDHIADADDYDPATTPPSPIGSEAWTKHRICKPDISSC